MKKILVFVTLIVGLASVPARADFWGGDVVVLSQILIQTIEELMQLKAILSNGQDSLNLLQSINAGINDSLSLVRTISPNTNPGIYGNLSNVSQALQAMQGIYGIVSPSSDARVQQDADQSVAEAVSLDSKIYEYTAQIDQIGEQVKNFSHAASPGGAQKLTAQTLGVMLNVMNENLRAQATGLKMQAQTLAIQNHKDKQLTTSMLSNSSSLQVAMKSEPVDFSIPRF
jgi:hypothetical protein